MNQSKTAGQLITSLPFLLMTCNTIVDTCLSVILHQNRFRRLSTRVKAVQAHITPLFDQTQTVLKDPQLLNFVLLLKTSLEDTLTFSKRFLKNDRKLAIRVFKFGSDEEEFIKLSERIENCITALSLPVDLGIFKHSLDDEDFLTDCKTLKTHAAEILSLLAGKLKDRERIERMTQQLSKLLVEQEAIRGLYRNKRPLASDITLEEKDVEYLDVIGSGSFGQVFKGRYKNEVVAIKKLQSVALSSEAVRNFKAEANMMRRLSHPRTLACIGVSHSPGSHCMVIEYMQNKSLTDYIAVNEENPAEWPYRLDISLDIAIGMSYLHRLQIIHRSLKSANVLLDQYLRVKIADFGMSVARTETATIMKVDEFGKAAQYMAPECFGLSPKYSTKSDMFSFSMILWEICHWKAAFANLDMYEIKDLIRAGERLPIHEAIPKSFESIMNCGWEQDQLKRPTFSEIQAFLEVIDFSEDVSNENSIFKIKPPKPAPPAAGSSLQFAASQPPSIGNQASSQNLLSPRASTTGTGRGNNAPPPIPPETTISNTALTKFWSDYTSTFDKDEINWDTFFLFIIDVLQIRAPYRLDTEKLRKKMDLKMSATSPTLRKLYQMIQDKTPQEFFSRYVIKNAIDRTANESAQNDSVICGSQIEQKSFVHVKGSSLAAKGSSSNHFAVQVETKDTMGPVSGSGRSKTWIYVCIGILVLIAAAAVVIYIVKPIHL